MIALSPVRTGTGLPSFCDSKIKSFLNADSSVLLNWIVVQPRRAKSLTSIFSSGWIASTFMLSTKPGKEAWVEPVIEGNRYHFAVRTGTPQNPEAVKVGTSAGKRAAFKCVMSGVPVPYDYIRGEGKSGRMGARLMAIVAEGERERIYLSPTPEHEKVAASASPGWKPDCVMPSKHRNFQPPAYGMDNLGDIFSSRQLVALSTLSDLVADAARRVRTDAEKLLAEDNKSLSEGGKGAAAYAESVACILALSVDKAADYWSTICFWHNGAAHQKIVNTFGRQAIPMSWDFAEANPFSESSGHFYRFVSLIGEVFDVAASGFSYGKIDQQDAAQTTLAIGRVISTDPPYYDNIAYADLSDFFYVWLRRAAQSIYPDIFATLEVPKSQELVALVSRHGTKEKAESFFLEGMRKAMHQLAVQAHVSFPITIYYAFKQSESDQNEGTASTGWETFLDAIIQAGFGISGTWPMRTELVGNLKKNISALASSIVLVCRTRATDAPTATRREFVAALQRELPEALRHLQAGNIAPVDLAQAAIGPGMAVFTRYARVLDAQGIPLSVREALALINETLDTALAEQEGDFDSDTRWALAWFEQHGFAEGEYGVAETLSKAKNTSIRGLEGAGILESKRGKVRLLKPEELPVNWEPATDARLTHWETVHHLIRVLTSGGESGAAELVRKLGTKAEASRELAYRLYTVCERKKRAAEALAYNGLVQSWPEITRMAGEEPTTTAVPKQSEFL